MSEFESGEGGSLGLVLGGTENLERPRHAGMVSLGLMAAVWNYRWAWLPTSNCRRVTFASLDNNMNFTSPVIIVGPKLIGS